MKRGVDRGSGGEPAAAPPSSSVGADDWRGHDVTIGRRLMERVWAYIFVAPLMIGVLGFFIGPILFSFYLSLTNWSSLKPGAFIGIGNYLEALRDPRLLRELLNTLYYVVGTVPISL